jgi:hypothetical protein
MTDTPEKIWRWAVQNCGGFIEYSDFPVIAKHSTEYTRTDISQRQFALLLSMGADKDNESQARIAELEAQAIGFRESIRKAALDSEHGHEILDLCWDSYFPEMPVAGDHIATLKTNKDKP